MGRASYAILEQGDKWVVLHDGETNGDFLTKEAALNLRGLPPPWRSGRDMKYLLLHPGREAGNGTALGAKDNA